MNGPYSSIFYVILMKGIRLFFLDHLWSPLCLSLFIAISDSPILRQTQMFRLPYYSILRNTGRHTMASPASTCLHEQVYIYVIKGGASQSA